MQLFKSAAFVLLLTTVLAQLDLGLIASELPACSVSIGRISISSTPLTV